MPPLQIEDAQRAETSTTSVAAVLVPPISSPETPGLEKGSPLFPPHVFAC